MNKAVIIGSGFAGLSAACFLAKAGVQVTVLEKNEQPGGRARSFTAEGFKFDMGPSWYWMPDVFERFFESFNSSPAAFYDLKRLDPSYKVVWQDGEVCMPAAYNELRQIFESMELGAAEKLDLFLAEAAEKYNISMDSLVYKPGLSLTEFISWDVARSLTRIDLFTSMHSHIRRYFRHPKLIQLAEFPILFLGALPKNTPALYSMMNYADMKLGTWYPMGGMIEIVNAMYQLAVSLGVEFKMNEPAEEIISNGREVTAVKTTNGYYEADYCVAACDYHYADQHLLQEPYRNYSKKYWASRKLSPSSLIFYIGVNGRLDNLEHHNLFFDAPFDEHANTLYENPAWPEDPLMYVCCPSKTDNSVAPEGCENLFVLIPVAPGLQDTAANRDVYFDKVIQKLEERTGRNIRDSILYKRSYAHNDFEADYFSFKGNAYGLSNTLMQTAILKPSVRNKKLPNLYYAGQLTVPGPGVPPALISGQIVAKEIIKTLKPNTVFI